MAEGEERPGEIPEELSVENIQDSGTPRQVKIATRRAFLGGLGTLLGGAALIGTKTGRDLARTGLEAVGILDEQIHTELPPLPEFQPPERDQRVLVIPLLEQGEKEPLSAERLETLFLNLAGSKFKTDSYGKIDYSFKVLPWDFVDLPNDRDRTEDVAAIGDARLESSGISELDQYQTRMYVLLSDSDTKAGGYGEKRKPTTYNRAWIYANEDVGIYLDDVIRHELGHTLGMPHANSVDARGRRVKEYGGVLDPMGNSAPDKINTMNALQRVALGWIGPEQVQSVRENGVYKVMRVEKGDPMYGKINAPLVLRLQKPDTNERYYVSYREKEGGAQLEIHRWDEKLESAALEVTTDFSKWSDGAEFYDKKNGIRIKQVSHAGRDASPEDSGTVNVQITFDKK